MDTSHNPADVLSNFKDDGSLCERIVYGYDRCPVRQWLHREKPSFVNGKESDVCIWVPATVHVTPDVIVD